MSLQGLREYGIPQEFMDVRESFEVVRKPMVAVRSQPSTDSLIAAGLDFSVDVMSCKLGGEANLVRPHRNFQVFSVEFGQHVDTFGADDSGQWRRVYCQCTKAAKQAGGGQTVKANRSVVVAVE